MIMRRESRSKAPNSSDLLVCFPSRAHLTLMPKTICSPSRPSEASKHGQSLALSKYNKNKSLLKRARTRGGGWGARGSPVLWAKSKSGLGQEMEEPTSPKVTCAGQIRVRPKSSACKNWQSVMEEIERIHKKGRQKKKPSWLEALGLKKDAMHFLTCLRTLHLDFRCFGAFPAGADVTSEDEDEDEDEEEEEEDRADDEDEESSRTVFSKWFMVLQDEQKDKDKDKEKIKEDDDDDDDEVEVGGGICIPPPNALLLMRCRSAPAKSWLEEKAEEEEEKKKYEDDEREAEKKKENVMLMRYDPEYYKISSDIAKETWVVGGMGDVLSRSLSCKR